MKDVFVVVLVAIQAGPGADALPLGAASVAACLKADPELKDRITVHLVEAPAPEADTATRLAAEIAGLKPDLVGLSVYLWNRPVMRELALILGAAAARPLLCAGGPDAGADPAHSLQELGLDFVVRGEGELAMVRVLRRLLDARDAGRDLRQSLVDLVPGGLIEGSASDSRETTLVSPWLDGTLDPATREGVLWELARGCPFACTFCYESRGNRGIRPLPMERLRGELELFRARQVRQVFVLDPTFNANRQRALEFLGLIRSRAGECHWRFEIRAEFLDREQAQAFAALSCSVQIGLQSSHAAVLAKVGRSLDRADFSRRIALLNEFGVVFGFDLIYGLPGDTLAGFRQSLDWVLSLYPNHLDVFGLAVLPGTKLADDAPGLGLNWQIEAPYLVQSGPGFPALDMGIAAGLARAVDLFYNRGRAVPWFNAVLRALKQKPARFFGDFADWLKERSAEGHRAVELLQLEFLSQHPGCLDAAGPGALAALVRDLVSLNGACSRAFAEDEESRLELNWDPDRLMGPEVQDLRQFARTVAAKPTTLRVFKRSGSVALERVRTGGRR